ncbi:nucleotidyltransferase-like protein [Pelagirhabdus alkalitolerans]|nr:nucleotidyltransferase-like protein [Pelagirhabdus alkalitolerans]
MEDLLRSLYQERASDPDTLGVIKLYKTNSASPVTDQFDVVLLIIVENAQNDWYVKHYLIEDYTCAMHVVDKNRLEYWIDTSSYRRMVYWVTEGDVVYDQNEYVSKLREDLDVYPKEKRELRLAIEFAKLTRSYQEAKSLYKNRDFLDSYQKIISAIHSLGRLSLIQEGFYPEMVVWNQVRRIDPATYKLYEELLNNNEPINERLELMMLAIDFAINGKIGIGSSHLLNVMGDSSEKWGFKQLKSHPSVQEYQLDLSMMLAYLIEKEYVQVTLEETKGVNVYHRLYSKI